VSWVVVCACVCVCVGVMVVVVVGLWRPAGPAEAVRAGVCMLVCVCAPPHHNCARWHPHTLRAPVQVGDELVLLVRHARPEVRHAQVRLLAVPQVALRGAREGVMV
jgi:hypothetical protein